MRAKILFVVTAALVLVTGCALKEVAPPLPPPPAPAPAPSVKPAPVPLPPIVTLDEGDQVPDDGFYKKTVHYGTTRRDMCETIPERDKSICLINPERLDTGNDESVEIRYGRVTVKIPFTKERGSTAGMRLISMTHGIEWDDFISNLTADDLLVFIHGYNTSFSDAAIRCAQLAHDTNFKGEAVLFSWPSKSFGTVSGYKKDKDRAKENFDVLADFLQKLASNTDKKIHLIAHSMGTYVLVNALALLDERIDKDDKILKARRASTGGKIFNQVILAAPDIAKKDYHMTFNDYDLSSMAERITLYSSINDVVLKGSRLINLFVEGSSQVRLGDSSSGFTVFKGMDTIDTRQEIKPQIIGHSFYAEYPSMVTDIHILLRYGTHPDGRILQKVADNHGNILWFIIDDRD